jgi:ribosomal protein S9
MSNNAGGGSASGSLSRSKETASSFNIEAVKRKVSNVSKAPVSAQSTERFAKISENPFFKIMSEKSLSPEEKRDAMIKALIVDPELSKEQNREKLEALNVFKEYMQAQRIALNERNMALSETGAFSDLQAVLKDMNTSLIDFEETMKPLTDILDAVYELRQAGKTLDVFKEIRNDKEWEAERKKEIEAFTADVAKLEAEIQGRNGEIANLHDQRKWFGLGGIKESAKVKIAELNALNASTSTQVGEVAGKIQETKSLLQGGPGTDHPELARQKQILREMLDITTDQHKDRQQQLVDTARKFVEFSRTRTSATLDKFEDMKDQIQRSADVTVAMQQSFAIVDEAVKAAEKENTVVRTQFTEPVGTPGSVVEIARTSKLDLVNEFINNMNDTSMNTTKSIEELERERMQVQTMQDANRENIRSARELSTSGVATIAGQLSAVLTGIGSAALVQSTESARETMHRMGNLTQDTLMKEVISNANRRQDVNSEMVVAIERLGQYSEVQKAGLEISRAAITEMRKNMDAMKEASAGLGQVVEEGQSVSAEVVAEHLAGSESNDNRNKKGGLGSAPGFLGGPS